MPKAIYVLYGCMWMYKYCDRMTIDKVSRVSKMDDRARVYVGVTSRQKPNVDTTLRVIMSVNNTRTVQELNLLRGDQRCTHRTRQTAAAGTRIPQVRHIHSMAAGGTPGIPSQPLGQV